MSRIVTEVAFAGYAPVLNREETEDGVFVWVASHPYFLGLLAQAETREEALRLWSENLADRLQDMAEDGLPKPPENRIKVIVRSHPGLIAAIPEKLVVVTAGA